MATAIFQRPRQIQVLHVLALAALVLSMWSGGKILLDQYPWLAKYVSLPAMHAPQFWHLVMAAVWLSLIAGYVLLRNLSVRKPSRHPVYRQARIGLWLLYLAISALVVSGSVLYLVSFSLNSVRLIHIAAGLGLLIVLVIHLYTQFQLGNWRRLFSIIPRRHYASLVAMLLCGMAVIATLFGIHVYQGQQQLSVRVTAIAPEIDGNGDEAIWAATDWFEIATYYRLQSEDGVLVQVKALRDQQMLYLLLRWPDTTHSRNHLPLIKTELGWQLQQNGFAQSDEQTFYEDKLAVMLANERWAALRSVLLDGHQQRGFHAAPENTLLDIWHWKSVRNFGFNNLDDSFFAPMMALQPGQRRYAAGYLADPIAAGGYTENWRYYPEPSLMPLRLPRDPELLRQLNANPSAESYGLYWHDTVPYHHDYDEYPVGTRMPSVVWRYANEGDRADVHARGQWQQGYWQVELARPLSTGSHYDVDITDGIYLWFATFDHSQIRHTYHLRPLQLKFEER